MTKQVATEHKIRIEMPFAPFGGRVFIDGNEIPNSAIVGIEFDAYAGELPRVMLLLHGKVEITGEAVIEIKQVERWPTRRPSSG
jgi:hypothetical protein